MNVMEVKALYVEYPSENGMIQALSGIDFSVAGGEIVGLVGESGSGKTTAVLAASGLLEDTAVVRAGQITVSGGCPVPGKNVALIFQNSMNCLNPTVKIGRQITETVRARKKCGRAEAEKRAAELLELTGISEPFVKMKRYPFELSGGQRQRVVIAIALACEPDIIIADEPTTALDPPVRIQIVQLLRKIVKETGTSLLLVSHDMGVTAALCSRIYVMFSGRIVESGTAAEIFYSPVREYTKRLIRGINEKKEETRVEAPILISMEHVTKKYGTDEGVTDLSLDIRKGETVALVGESGSGKTTLARILTGLTGTDGGKITYFGSHQEGDRKSLRPGKIQMVFQDPYEALNPCLTVEKTLEEALYCFRKGRISGKDCHGKPDRGTVREKVCEMIEMVGLQREDAGKYPEELSGGERQRVGIARALIVEPELLVCDEALSSLDTVSRHQIMGLLRDVSRKKGIACLFISHDLQVVRQISERTAVLFGGRVAECGPTEEICSDPWHPYTKVLTDAVLRPDPVRASRIRALFREESLRPAKTAAGCPFASRCGYVMDCCMKQVPERMNFGRREISCFLYSEKYSGKRSEGYHMISQI